MSEIYYYVVRQGDAEERLVPMIPIDQMPDWLEVVGVPRELQAEDAAKMTALLDIGRKEGARGTFQVRLLMDRPGEAPASTALTTSTDSTASTTSSTSSTSSISSATSLETSVTSATLTHAATDKQLCAGGPDVKQHDRKHDKNANREAQPDPRTVASTSNTVNTVNLVKYAGCLEPTVTVTKTFKTMAEAKPTPKSDVPSPAKSTTSCVPKNQTDKSDVLPCKYWCKYGRCGFKARCRFVHIMPLTREGLSLVDLDELPQWYVKKQDSKLETRMKGYISVSQHSNSSRDPQVYSGFYSPNSGTQAAHRKVFKAQKTTAISSAPSTTKTNDKSRSSSAPREAYKAKLTTPDAAAAAANANARDGMELGDLIDLT